MKFQPRSILLIIYLLVPSSVKASDCSVEQLNAFALQSANITEQLTACSTAKDNPEANATDGMKYMCAPERCGGLQKFADTLPVCTVSGKNLTTPFEEFVALCKGATVPTNAPSSKISCASIATFGGVSTMFMIAGASAWN